MGPVAQARHMARLGPPPSGWPLPSAGAGGAVVLVPVRPAVSPRPYAPPPTPVALPMPGNGRHRPSSPCRQFVLHADMPSTAFVPPDHDPYQSIQEWVAWDDASGLAED